jgi:hypothetical protein
MGTISRIFSMNVISRSKKRNYAQIVCIFLAVIALFLAIGGCNGGGGGDVDHYYSLTVTSTIGGLVIKPGESEFSYAANTTVQLIAEPDDHHHFVNWTGDVATIGNVTAASTNITMYDSYSIIANFELDEGWYSLTTFSGNGGSIAEPGEGYFPYPANTTVDLVAAPSDGWRFKEWTGDVGTIADVNAAATNITMNDSYSITANFEWFDIIQVAAGGFYTVGLKADGTVVAVGFNYNGQCNVNNWTDIIQISVGWAHTVGLRSDGTVVAVGHNWYGQCNVSGWADIIQIVAGDEHTVGLRSDGTVVSAGNNDWGQRNLGDWTDIMQVSASQTHTVGVKTDGTVVAVGYNDYGQCNVGGWAGITQVAAGWCYTLGLESDHTVAAVGDNTWGQCNVGNWVDIIQVTARAHTVGVKSDGTVVAVGLEVPEDPEEGIIDDYGQCDVGSWTHIVQVTAGGYHTVGLRSDGTVVAVGDNRDGQCDV